MSLGERISELRKEHNISQGQLAQMLEVSRQAVSKWENGQSSPDTVRLIQLADVLDTDVEYLATGKRTSNKPLPEVITIEKPVETIVEKIVEKPVVVEKIVEREKIVTTYVDKPQIKRVTRIKYLRNPVEFVIIGAIGFFLGLLLGFFL
jgi:transcriptional regulator with XRE-family HTH domain